MSHPLRENLEIIEINGSESIRCVKCQFHDIAAPIRFGAISVKSALWRRRAPAASWPF